MALNLYGNRSLNLLADNLGIRTPSPTMSRRLRKGKHSIAARMARTDEAFKKLRGVIIANA